MCMGYANLCALAWNDEYEASKTVLSNWVQEHLLEVSSYQIVEDFTRSEMSRNGISKSCLDHVYTNAPVVAAGDSDHLAVIVNKSSKEQKNKPRTVLKRNYKLSDPVCFLEHVQASKINEAVTACNDVNEAAKIFQELFSCILDFHAPRKIFQTRKNYVPYLSDEPNCSWQSEMKLKKKPLNWETKL